MKRMFFYFFCLISSNVFCFDIITSSPGINLNWTFVAILKDQEGKDLGEIYKNAINDTVFTDLIIVKSQKGVTDTLYKIVHENFFSGKDSMPDIQVYEVDFFGYSFRLIKKDYVVLNYYRKKGKFIGDNINLEWNYKKRRFEVLKAP